MNSHPFDAYQSPPTVRQSQAPPVLRPVDPLKWRPLFPPEPDAQTSSDGACPLCHRQPTSIGLVLGVLVLFGTAVSLIALFHAEIRAFLATMKNIAPGHSFEEQTIGCVAFGLSAASLLGLVRILSQRGGRS